MTCCMMYNLSVSSQKCMLDTNVLSWQQHKRGIIWCKFIASVRSLKQTQHDWLKLHTPCYLRTRCLRVISICMIPACSAADVGLVTWLPAAWSLYLDWSTSCRFSHKMIKGVCNMLPSTSSSHARLLLLFTRQWLHDWNTGAVPEDH